MKVSSRVLYTAVGISAGVLVLAGYFLDSMAARTVRLLLMRWAAILAAGALLLGLINLIWSVHLKKVVDQDKGWLYSSIVVVFFLVTFILGMVFGPQYRIVNLLFEYVQIPVEASLVALLSVALVLSGINMVLNRRRSGYLFVGSAALVLLGSTAWVVSSDSQLAVVLGYLRVWLTQIWAAAGARGILIGVALGAVATGLRVLLAADRPYGE